MPGPNWLSSWVRVNAKHVVFPPGTKKDDDPTKRSLTSEMTGSTAESSGGAQPLEEDPEQSAIKRFSNRRNRRRLQRTRSASDLIRDMANGKTDYDADSAIPAMDFSDSTISVTSRQSSSQTAEAQAAVRPLDSSPSLKEREGDLHDPSVWPTGTSARLAAGLFGTAPEQTRKQPLQNNGKYLNEAAFIQQLEQQRQIPAASREVRGDSRHEKRPRKKTPPPVVPPPSPAPEETATSQNNNNKGLSLNFLPHPFFAPPEERPCHGCASLQSQLLTALGDLDYMRGVAQQNEHVCKECRNAKKTASSSLREQGKQSLGDASKQLNEVTARHKKQVEQLTKERTRWQQDMHFKLHKFANLCKDLNEESAVRNDEAIALKRELETVKSERDELVEEITRLRGEVETYEKEKAVYAETKEKLLAYEKQGLEHSDDAIQSRDTMIADLSSKLEQALDQLEAERAQQRQRRQIIFPNSTRS